MKQLVIKKTVYGFGVLLFALAMMVTSCSEHESAAGSARLEVRLTDAPAVYDAVNVDIQGLQVNVEEGDDDKDSTENDNDDEQHNQNHNGEGEDHGGWKSIDIHKGIYDLKKLTNGIDTLLGTATLPVGRISQIRLILGPNNTVVVNGKTFPLKTPSGEQSGLKLKVKQELKDGISYKIILDFDAALSIVARGNGEYILKPCLRSITQAVDGAIKGQVQPANAKASVYAITGTDTVSSTSADTTSGAFIIKGLKAGSYKVVVGQTTKYQSKEVSNVGVTNGQVTDVGIVELIHL